MKHIYYAIMSAAITVVLAATGCSETEVSSVGLQYSQYSFSSEADTLTVSVDFAGQEWETQAEAEWVQAVKQDAGSLVIMVGPNSSRDSREAVVSVFTQDISETIRIRQEGFIPDVKMTDFYDVLGDVVMSRNGRFVAYPYLSTNLSRIPMVTDMETGEEFDYAGVVDGYITILAIADDGQTLLIQNSNMEPALLDKDGMEILSIAPYESFEPCAMSSDASVIVGVAEKDGAGMPAVWKDGAITELECPAEDPVGNDLLPGNVYVKGCSSDGSVIYGAEYRSGSYGLIYWKDGVLHNPGNDYAEVVEVLVAFGSYLSRSTRANTVAYDEEMNGCFLTSPDGRWMTAKFVTYEQRDEESAAIIHTCPVIIDLTTGEMTKVEANINESMGLAVDDSGMIFGVGAGFNGTNGFVFDPATQQAVSISDYFKNTYGVLLDVDRDIRMVGDSGSAFIGKKEHLTYWYLKL